MTAPAIRYSRRRVAMLSQCATGWLPWGVPWSKADGFPCLPLCGRRYVMSCGMVMGLKEAQLFVDAGLLTEGLPGRGGRRTLIITRAGRDWLADYF